MAMGSLRRHLSPVAVGTAEPYVHPSYRAAAVVMDYFDRSAILKVREVTGIA
jgi:hypothetical protein